MAEFTKYEESQHELLNRLREGDESAFRIIYNTYSIKLLGNLIRLLKSEDLAKEVLQNVFLKIWDKRASIDAGKSFQSWVYKIAENQVYDIFRSVAKDKKRQTEFISNAGTYQYEEIAVLLKEEKAQLLEKAIKELPAQRQLVFRLCKLEGKSYKEVSSELGISVSTISDHIVKATKSVKAYFENNESALSVLFIVLFFI